MKTINLRWYPGPALIVPCSSGVNIEQQVGGISCVQKSVEGIFLPLPLQAETLRYFVRNLEAIHLGCWGEEITFQEACKLDDMLKMYNMPVEVIKEKRKGSTEAWVHVRIMGKDDKWTLRPNSSELWEYHKFAKTLKPDIREKEVLQLLEKNILENNMFHDFAGEEAILTWENCD